MGELAVVFKVHCGGGLVGGGGGFRGDIRCGGGRGGEGDTDGGGVEDGNG